MAVLATILAIFVVLFFEWLKEERCLDLGVKEAPLVEGCQGVHSCLC